MILLKFNMSISKLRKRLLRSQKCARIYLIITKRVEARFLRENITNVSTYGKK
jgi:hypothetical protein